MNQTTQLGGALLALLIALPLVSYSAGGSVLWVLGLALMIVGAGMPVYLRLHRGDSCHEKSKRRLWWRIRH
ncbi:MAG: hypothetical protein AAF787_05475 [Chloroflexota bacterium]